MKKLIEIFLKSCTVAMLICLLSANVFAGSDPTKEKDLYVLKTDRSFVGAKVDIYSSKGHVLTTQLLRKKKVIIDFTDVKDGYYIIRVSKGSKVKEFQFVKSRMKDTKI
jgi:hypothetical protein